MSALTAAIRRVAVLAIVAAALLACGSASPSSNSPESSAALGSTPSVEGSGPESPLSSEPSEPSLSVPSLPVGGAATPAANDPAQQCAGVSYQGPTPIPAGVQISIDEVSLDSADLFRLGGSACGDQTPCDSSTRWGPGSDSLACAVAVTQIANSTKSVSLLLAGTVRCSSQPVCDAFATELKAVENVHVEFSANPIDSLPTLPASTDQPSPSGSAS